MSVELKIKSKHLGEEARIIRFEEKKVFKQYQWAKRQHYATGSNDEYKYYQDPAYRTWESLNRHRRWDVRNENRATFLARAYLAGKDYKSVEQKCHDPSVLSCYIHPRVCEMVNKYGPADQKISKKFNTERKVYDYDQNLWHEHKRKIAVWLGMIPAPKV
jgi:hypothetical protein